MIYVLFILSSLLLGAGIPFVLYVLLFGWSETTKILASVTLEGVMYDFLSSLLFVFFLNLFFSKV